MSSEPTILSSTGHVAFQAHVLKIFKYLKEKKLGHLVDPVTVALAPKHPGQPPVEPIEGENFSAGVFDFFKEK